VEPLRLGARTAHALIAALPVSGAQSTHFSFDMTLEAFLEGHVRVFDWFGGVPRECIYDNLRSVVAKRDCRQVVRWNQRFLHLRGHYAFHSTACTPQAPREKGSVEGAVRYLKTGFWPARRFGTLGELDRVYADWRDRVAHQPSAERPLVIHLAQLAWVEEHANVCLIGPARRAPAAAAAAV